MRNLFYVFVCSLCALAVTACKTEHDSSQMARKHATNMKTTGQHNEMSSSLSQSNSARIAIIDGPLSPEQAKEMSGLEGNKIDVMISRLGVPDRVESMRDYGIIFGSGEASVVFLYDQIKIHVYVTRDCTILGITAMHEMK